jgi:quercetin dioxygenase-like cupin family protein
MKVSKPKVLDMLGARLEEVLVVESHGDGVLFRTVMQPGRVVPLHSHVDPEGFYVLEGEIEIFVMDDSPRWQSLRAGASVAFEDGVRHALRNSSSTPADLIVMTNRRLADYFRQVGRQAEKDRASTPPTRDEVEEMIRVTKDFGYWIVSPEESEKMIAQTTSQIHPLQG